MLDQFAWSSALLILAAAAGIVVGVLFVYLLGPVYTRAVSPEAVLTIDDPQGAIAFLPSFQIALYLALWVAAFAAVGRVHDYATLTALAEAPAALKSRAFSTAWRV